MVTDRKLIAVNGNDKLEITKKPYWLGKCTGLDGMKASLVTSQGFDQDGTTLVNAMVEDRIITLNGQIKGDTTAQMEYLRLRLLEIFKLKSDITLIQTYGGVTRQITCQVTKAPTFQFSNVTSVQSYTISMTACDPYWTDENEIVIYAADWESAFHFPFISPIDEGFITGMKSTSLIKSLYNASNIEIPLTIVFLANGTLENPNIFSLTTREELKIICEMHAGDQIIVSTSEKKITFVSSSGVEQNYISRVDIDHDAATFIRLQIGDNLIRYNADSNPNNLEVKFYYKNKYGGM